MAVPSKNYELRSEPWMTHPEVRALFYPFLWCENLPAADFSKTARVEPLMTETESQLLSPST